MAIRMAMESIALVYVVHIKYGKLTFAAYLFAAKIWAAGI